MPPFPDSSRVGAEDFTCIWSWSKGVVLCQCVWASRPPAPLKAGWVPHRHFPLLSAQLRKDTKVKSLPAIYVNLHCAKLFWCKKPFLVPKVMTWGQSPCYFSIKGVLAKCASRTLLSQLSSGITVNSPQLWPHVEALTAHKHSHASHIPLWVPSDTIMCLARGFSFCRGLKQVFLLPNVHLKPALRSAPVLVLPVGGVWCEG